MENQLKVNELTQAWYREFREENNLPKEEAVSPFDLIYWLAERDACEKLSQRRVAQIVSDTIQRLYNITDNATREDFIRIFGSDDLWLRFKNGHHQNIWRFLMDIEEEDKESFINYTSGRILSFINSQLPRCKQRGMNREVHRKS